MARRSSDEVKAGVVLVVAGGLLAVLLAAVGPCRSIFYSRYYVHVVFKDVSGLKPNSPVLYSGVEIGRVKEMTIIELNAENLARLPELGRDSVFELPVGGSDEEDRLYRIDDPAERGRALIEAIRGKTMVELTLEVLQQGDFQECRTGDLIRIDSTLMGDTSIQISPGSGRVCEEDHLLIGDAGNMFSDLRDSVEDIRRMMRRASVTMGQLDAQDVGRAVGSVIKGAEHFSEIAKNVNETASDVREIVAANKDDLRASVKDLAASLAQGREFIEKNRPRAEELVARATEAAAAATSAISSAGRKLDETLEAGRRAAAATEGFVSQAGPQLREVMTYASGALKRAEAAAAEAEALVAENRPAARRALDDIKGATRNVEEMTALLSRKPWLILRPGGDGDRDVASLLVSSRHLSDSAARLGEASGRLSDLARTGRLSRSDVDRLAEILKEMQETALRMEDSRKSVETKIEEMRRPARKLGGSRYERSRESPSAYPETDRLRREGAD